MTSTWLQNKIRSGWPSRGAAVLVMLLGVLSLLGWIFDIEVFKHWFSYGITIKANTAIALFLAGLSVWLYIPGRSAQWARRIGQACASVVLLLGAICLSEHLFGWDWGIDQLLFRDPPGPPGSLSPGRIGPPASLCFVLGGIALLLLHARSKKHHFYIQALSIAVLLISAPGMIGYAYGAEAMYGLAHYTAIAFHTAMALAILAMGILLARPEEGFCALILDEGFGGLLARRLLPAAILIPLTFGYFRLRWEVMGFFTAAFGTALMMFIMMTFFSTLILWSASVSRRMELARKRAEDLQAQERANLQAIFNVVNVGMLLIDESGAVRRVNNTVSRWIGKNLADHLGLQPGGLVGCIHAVGDPALCGHTPHCTLCPIRNTFESVLRTDRPVHDVESLATLAIDGKEVSLWLEASADPLNLDGRRHVVLALNDITARKRMEEELRRSHEVLEERVRERTAEISTVNQELALEIAERKKVEQVVKAERQQFNEVLDSLPVYVVLLTRDYHVQFANRFFRERFGESNGNRCYEYLFNRTEPCENCETYKVLDTNAPQEWFWTGPDGRDYHIFDHPFTDADGSQLILEMGLDITERKRAETALRESEQRYRTLFETMDEGFCVIEMLYGPQGEPRDYRFLEINPAFENHSGLENALGKTIREMVPDHEEHWFRIFGQVARTGEAVRFENRSAGLKRWFDVYAFRLGGAESQKVAILFNDITARKRMEEELRASSRYARSLLEASLDPLVTISPDGKITDVNRATESVTGVDRDALIGSSFSRYFTEPEKADAGYRQVLSEGSVNDYPLTIRHISGRMTDVLNNATVYHNEAGEVQGVFAAARDVTERKRAEEELGHYREHLEELVDLRTEELSRSNLDLEQFAYVASHDLQEPLRMVAGYLQLLEDRYKSQLDEKADKYINYAVDGAARMSGLIRDLLAFSRVNTRGAELCEADSQKAFESALRNLGSSIAESGATITHDPLPTVRADSMQLAQVFQNLLGNALKFRSPDRPPRIHVAVREELEQWLFSVRDNGIGFEQEYEDKIFLIFQRLHGRGHYPGTGIGLAICKRIIERHGGKIWATSTPGEGTTFYFTLPL